MILKQRLCPFCSSPRWKTSGGDPFNGDKIRFTCIDCGESTIQLVIHEYKVYEPKLVDCRNKDCLRRANETGYCDECLHEIEAMIL